MDVLDGGSPDGEGTSLVRSWTCRLQCFDERILIDGVSSPDLYSVTPIGQPVDSSARRTTHINKDGAVLHRHKLVPTQELLRLLAARECHHDDITATQEVVERAPRPGGEVDGGEGPVDIACVWQ